MPGYVNMALIRFKHWTPKRWQDQPYLHVIPIYGAKTQYAVGPDGAALLDKDGTQFVQQFTGTFLYYARAVDSTMLVTLSALASEQASPTKKTMEKVMTFLDYAASQEEAMITYHASDMVLACHSGESYLSELGARSRSGGNFFLSSNAAIPANNGAVLNIAQIIKAVMRSAAEAEIGAIYINAREAVPQIMTLSDIGHPQPRTPMQTNNLAAHDVVTNNVQPRRTKAMDMIFHWLQCRDAQGQFRYYWKPGTMNLEDYWTKHHPSSHHKNIRSSVLAPMKDLIEFWARHMASTEKMQAQKKTQLTNMNQFKSITRMLEEKTVRASVA